MRTKICFLPTSQFLKDGFWWKIIVFTPLFYPFSVSHKIQLPHTHFLLILLTLHLDLSFTCYAVKQQAMRPEYGQSHNFPHPGRIACCSAPNSRPPATKALRTICGNNTSILSSSWQWAYKGHETCWADYKCNKAFSSIWLVFFSTLIQQHTSNIKNLTVSRTKHLPFLHSPLTHKHTTQFPLPKAP